LDGSLHQPGRKERHRNRHIGLSDAAFFARSNLIDSDGENFAAL
jgi:hypothetical protein